MVLFPTLSHSWEINNTVCCCSVDWFHWFIVITDLSYLPPCGELRCLLVEDLTILSPRGELAELLWRYWLPPHGDLSCLFVEILVASPLSTRVELLSPHGELHFSTGFRRYGQASYVFIFP